MSANAQPIFFTNVVLGSLKILTFKTLIQYAFNIVLFLLVSSMALSVEDSFAKKASLITPFSRHKLYWSKVVSMYQYVCILYLLFKYRYWPFRTL
jgi:hypothetical protein